MQAKEISSPSLWAAQQYSNLQESKATDNSDITNLFDIQDINDEDYLSINSHYKHSQKIDSN